MIDSGVSAIMSAYLSFPLVEPTGAPATFSKYFLNDLLRGELGFAGLIVTDDIMMNGATEYAGSVSRAVQLAILAGNDIVESSTTPGFRDALWVKSLELMKSSPEFRARVANAANRVLLAKLDYFKGDNPVPVYPDPKTVDDLVPDPDARAFFLSQAARSVTLVRAGTFPLGDARGKTLIAGSYPSFLEAGKRRFPDADTAPVNGKLWGTARAYDTVVYCLSGKDSLAILRDLQWSSANVVVVSALSPVLLTEVPRVKTALAVYSYAPVSFEAAFSALAGDFAPEGTMPLEGVK
jgi:beta-N-acetylhexosaminidase